MTIRRQHLLASTLFTAAAIFAAAPQLAYAQEPTAAQAEEESTEVGEVVVTGTRIPKNEFNSAQPIQVLTAERAQASGVADTVQFLQNSTIAAGSPQVNPVISSAFVTDGGPGAATISLRGLGAQRTLVLMNSRRAGPAGTRGAVSTFDLNVLPQSSIDHIDILKDGASSIYGSDAVAGVVNIITKRNRNGGEVSAFYTDPFDTGGEQMDFAASYGRSFDRFRFSLAADYYKQNEQRVGERDYTQCAAQYFFRQDTGARGDVIDPRTNSPWCNDNPWGQVWIYGGGSTATNAFGRRFAGKYQYNYDNNLQNFIPVTPGTRDGFCGNPASPGTSQGAAIRNVDPDCYPTAPNGFFLVAYNTPTQAFLNANSPLEDAQSLVPEITRTTLFMDGSYDLTGTTQIYTELLANRRESFQNGYRQYWSYNTTPDYVATGGRFLPSDNIAAGWSGPFIMSPTPITDWNDTSQQVDYTRAVLGVRGGFSMLGLKDWSWDIFGQHSRSLGTYTNQIILQDAIDAITTEGWSDNSSHSGSCAGQILPVSGRTCVDVNLYDPRVLAGNLNDAERAFLFDTDVGKTKYIQNYLEGSIAGNWFDLGTGPVGLALGFHIQEDKIRDVPGLQTRQDNSWGLSSAGITEGTSKTKEVYGEMSIPLVKDRWMMDNLGLTLSGRYTDVDVAGTATTYKVGLNWEIMPSFRLRYTHGTSFRSPALFELFLANQTSFIGQRTIDPCINWQAALDAGTIPQLLADNCANPLGPGGGVPGDTTGSGAEALYVQGGGIGVLKPETSASTVYGAVWTPKFIDLRVAVDYFEIHVKNEVTLLGGNIPAICYLSENFPTDPVCGLFDRDPNTKAITELRDSYINISDQINRGLDLSVRYRHSLPWKTDLTIDGQFTWQLEDETAVFPGVTNEENFDVTHPAFNGRVDATFNHGDWTFLWGAQLIGEQSDARNRNSETITNALGTFNVVVRAPFTAFHYASLRKDWKDMSVIVGVSNIFDKEPPQATPALGFFSTVGTSVLSSQYTEGYYGRRGFVRVSKKF
jgi:iron complex outermembrane recepter protein